MGPFGFREHLAGRGNLGRRQGPDLAVEGLVRGCQGEGDAGLLDDLVPALDAGFGVGDVVVAQALVECV